MTQEDLDTLFAAARAAPPAPSDALMARVMADALAHQPAARPAAITILPAPARPSFWQGLSGIFGGAGALAGIGGAAVAGLFIGLAQPALLVSLSEAYVGGALDSVALMPDVDTLFAEVAQ